MEDGAQLGGHPGAVAAAKVHICRGTHERGWWLRSILASPDRLEVVGISGYDRLPEPGGADLLLIDADPGSSAAHALVLAVVLQRLRVPVVVVVAGREDVPLRRAAHGLLVLERDIGALPLRTALLGAAGRAAADRPR